MHVGSCVYAGRKFRQGLRHAANFADTRQDACVLGTKHVPTAGGNATQDLRDPRFRLGRNTRPVQKSELGKTHFFPSTSTPACLSNVRFQRFSSDSAGAVSDARRAATPGLLSGALVDDEAAADILGRELTRSKVENKSGADAVVVFDAAATAGLEGSTGGWSGEGQAALKSLRLQSRSVFGETRKKEKRMESGGEGKDEMWIIMNLCYTVISERQCQAAGSKARARGARHCPAGGERRLKRHPSLSCR